MSPVIQLSQVRIHNVIMSKKFAKVSAIRVLKMRDSRNIEVHVELYPETYYRKIFSMEMDGSELIAREIFPKKMKRSKLVVNEKGYANVQRSNLSISGGAMKVVDIIVKYLKRVTKFLESLTTNIEYELKLETDRKLELKTQQKFKFAFNEFHRKACTHDYPSCLSNATCNYPYCLMTEDRKD